MSRAQRSFGKQLHTILGEIKSDEDAMASLGRRLSERDGYARSLEGELTRLRAQAERDAQQVQQLLAAAEQLQTDLLLAQSAAGKQGLPDAAVDPSPADRSEVRAPSDPSATPPTADSLLTAPRCALSVFLEPRSRPGFRALPPPGPRCTAVALCGAPRGARAAAPPSTSAGDGAPSDPHIVQFLRQSPPAAHSPPSP